MDDTAGLKQYHGNCHCGSFKFSIKVPEVRTLPVCNCSICVRNGLLLIYPVADDDFTVESGEGTLTKYEFGGKTYSFCSKCGSTIGAHSKDSEIRVGGINARLLRDLGLNEVILQPSKGRADAGANYQPPSLPDWEGEVEEGLKVYKGNCHCGAVTYAVKTKPLGELKAMNCNCSLCSRNSDLWIYPTKACVQVHGIENLTDYLFLDEKSLHSFCKTCSTSVLVKVADAAGDDMPLNIRTIEGIDLESLEYIKYDGRSNNPQYSI